MQAKWTVRNSRLSHQDPPRQRSSLFAVGPDGRGDAFARRLRRHLHPGLSTRLWSLPKVRWSQVPLGAAQEQVLIVLGIPPHRHCHGENLLTMHLAEARLSASFRLSMAGKRRGPNQRGDRGLISDKNRRVARLANYGLRDGKVFDFVSRNTPTAPVSSSTPTSTYIFCHPSAAQPPAGLEGPAPARLDNGNRAPHPFGACFSMQETRSCRKCRSSACPTPPRRSAIPGGRVNVLWQQPDSLVFMARGREYRSEFHINPSDEVMYPVKGDLKLHYRTEDTAREGDRHKRTGRLGDLHAGRYAAFTALLARCVRPRPRAQAPQGLDRSVPMVSVHRATVCFTKCRP